MLVSNSGDLERTRMESASEINVTNARGTMGLELPMSLRCRG